MTRPERGYKAKYTEIHGTSVAYPQTELYSKPSSQREHFTAELSTAPL